MLSDMGQIPSSSESDTGVNEMEKDAVENEADKNEKWMSEAQLMVLQLRICDTVKELNTFVTQAEEALAASEVPVGCVFVRDGRIIAKARNRTNELRNVSLHYLLCNTPSFD